MIKPCKHHEFLKNIQEIQNFTEARATLPVIKNTEKLLNVIKIYFQTLLYYKKNSHSKYIVKIKETLFEIKMGGTNKEGTSLQLDLIEVAESLITSIIKEINKTLNDKSFTELLNLLNLIFLNSSISNDIKINIINSENKGLNDRFALLLPLLPEELALKTIKIRKKTLIHILIQEKESKQDKELDDFIISINEGYILYLRLQLRIHIKKNHFTNIFNDLKEELSFIEKNRKIEKLDFNKIVWFLLHSFIVNNNLFQIENKEEVLSLVEDYKDYITKEEFEVANESINFNPNNFTLGSFSVETHDTKFEEIENIKTVISFVLPFKIDENLIFEDIEFIRINDLFDDPIFSILNQLDQSINGLPITFFSDSVGKIGNSTLVNIKINDFFHPDFDLVKNKISYKNFEIEDALHGGKFYPHKGKIIEILFKYFESSSLPFKIEKNNITSNLISNYLVQYLDYKTNLNHHKVHLITNFNAYFNAKDRFLSNMNKLHLKDDSIKIRELILETEINNNKIFLEFIYKLLDLTVKKAIEFSSLHKSFWNVIDGNKKPKRETDAQIIIYNQIRYICELKGIQVSKEIEASDGSLDFHLSYTTKDTLLSIPIELKNAHHKLLDHGIESQLPLYINDIGRREGIFLVLWYKYEMFDSSTTNTGFAEPAKFNSVLELEKHLLSIIPKRYKIKPMIIDCSPKISPSKKRAENRL